MQRGKVILAATIGLLTIVPLASAQDAVTRTAPRVVVRGQEPRSEDDLIGDNQQPEWTAYRRFPTTRVYVLPPWQLEFEQWWNGVFPREGTSEHRFMSEIEIGLPYRFQVDVYQNFSHASHDTTATNQVEARWAFADWGKIPLNPTLYIEGKFPYSGPDAYEVRLLLGEELAPRWHWAGNLFYEQQTGGGRATEWGFSQAVSYSLLDRELSVGIEMNFENTTEKNSRGDPSVEFLVGPSVQWRPTRRTHLDLVPLFGTTRDSPIVEPFIVFGIELGGGHEAKGPESPISTRGR